MMNHSVVWKSDNFGKGEGLPTMVGVLWINSGVIGYNIGQVQSWTVDHLALFPGHLVGRNGLATSRRGK